MENLRVLDMCDVCFKPWRTSFTHSLKNLQTLSLSFCKIDGVDTIGELQKLKILKIDCSLDIEELSANISQLTELKVLHVSHCFKLKVIHPNIISSMTKLEELNLLYSFQGWGEEVSYKGKTIKNAKLSELNSLTQLSILKIDIKNVDMLLNELSLVRVKKLQDFDISGGDVKWATMYGGYGRSLKVDINWKTISWESGVLQTLMQGCEIFHVRSDSVGFTKALFKPNANYFSPRLKHLEISINEEDSTDMAPHDDEVQNINPLFATDDHHHDLFTELMELCIEKVDNLEMLWHNDWITAYSFCKLQSLCIHYCNKLTYVIPSNMIKSLLSLRVWNCELLERIFEVEDLMDDAKRIVPLTTLYLSDLPNLKYVWNNDPGDRLTFSNLENVTAYDCPRLRNIFPASFIKHMDTIETLKINGEMELFVEDESSNMILTPEFVLFPNVTSLEIHCKMAEKISFWHRSSESFPKLQSLELIGCKDDGMVTLPLEMSDLVYTIENFTINNVIELVQVFQNGETNERGTKLRTLTLKRLPKLTRVWEDNNTQMITNFDSLESIEVYDCEKLKCLLPSSITCFNLIKLEVENCNGMTSLFSSSMANKLANLTTMSIKKCKAMSSIIVADGGEEKEITFKRLNNLTLRNLPRLTSFLSEKSKLKFPFLDELCIESCNEMKTFSYGIISMPKLLIMKMKDGNVPVSQTKDLNVIFKDLWEIDIGRSIKTLFTQQGEEYTSLRLYYPDITLNNVSTLRKYSGVAT